MTANLLARAGGACHTRSMTTPEPPADDAALVAGIRALHAAVERLDTLAAARLGVGRSDWRCLALLTQGPLAPRALMQRLGLTSGSVTALVDRLTLRGLAERQPDPADRRGVLVAATPLGEQAVAEAHHPLGEVAGRLAIRYGPERTAEALRYLSDAARIGDWAATRLAGGEG